MATCILSLIISLNNNKLTCIFFSRKQKMKITVICTTCTYMCWSGYRYGLQIPASAKVCILHSGKYLCFCLSILCTLSVSFCFSQTWSIHCWLLHWTQTSVVMKVRSARNILSLLNFQVPVIIDNIYTYKL